jgi:O-antigen/teichoic acid export membrane protein
LLIALSEQITASLLLFVRQGSWAIATVALMSWDTDSRRLDAVMALWACAGIAAATLGIVKLRRLRMGGWRSPIDRGWIRKGVAVSAAFLVATLALRGIQTADRYWLEALGGIEIVGAYVLFLGMAGALMVFLDAAVFSYAYPQLIRLDHDNNRRKARVMVWRMFFQTLSVSAAFSVASWLLLPILLRWVGNPVYENAIGLYPWVLMATVINAVGMVPHYALYARGRDKPIIWSHVAALPAFILSTWAIGGTHPVIAVPLGLGVSFTLILVWKTAACWLNDREGDKPDPAVNSI